MVTVRRAQDRSNKLGLRMDGLGVEFNFESTFAAGNAGILSCGRDVQELPKAWSIASSSSQHSTAVFDARRGLDDQEDLLGLKLKKAMMRGSFETPEARHSFCLSAFRPSMDLETDGMVSENTSAASSFDDVHPRAMSICPKLRPYLEASSAGLERTDTPLAGLDLHSVAIADLASAYKKAKITPTRQAQDAEVLDVGKLWAAAPAPKFANPFEGLPDDAGFFNCPTSMTQ